MIEDVKDQLELQTPKGRSERLGYIKDMLNSYQSGNERYPRIEFQLRKKISELMKPASAHQIKELNQKLDNLQKKL